MGNCVIRSKKALAPMDEHEPHRTFPASKLETKGNFDSGESTKTVRFRVRGESRVVDVEPKGEVLRIKVVVTQEELKQILKNLKYSSIEQLETAMKLRGRRICEERTNDEGSNSNWRPALESIPEDH